MHVKERGQLAGAGLSFCTTWVPWFLLRFSGFTGSRQQLHVKNFDDTFSSNVRCNKQIIFKSLVFSHFLFNKIFYFCLHFVLKSLLIRIKKILKITFVIYIETWSMCFEVKWCQGIQVPQPAMLQIKSLLWERSFWSVHRSCAPNSSHLRTGHLVHLILRTIFKLPRRMDTNEHLVHIAFSAQLISTLSGPERLLIALVEDLGSVPSIHLAAHDHL